MPSGAGTDLHDSDLSQSQPTKQRASTLVQADHNHIELTKASLQSRPRPAVAKTNSGTVSYDLS